MSGSTGPPCKLKHTKKGEGLSEIEREHQMWKRVTTLSVTWTFFLTAASSAYASESQAPEWDTGNIAWMLTSSALVLMMTAPGLALFYGGLVRKKNILSVMMQCIFLMGLMSVIWVICGYSLAFGGTSPYFGNFDHLFLSGVLPTADTSFPELGDSGIPLLLFAAFQGMFFIITPALICGAFAERMKFSAMCLFSVLWGTLVYCPVAHWVWADTGWLCEWNSEALFPAIDFAGGTVVHISSGVSALICALVLGKRLGFGQEPMPPHNLTYTFAGTGLLWMGWFGFNGGSALAANAAAVNAMVATHVCAAAGVLSWSACEWIGRGKPSILGACSGAVAGLVCITPASGSVTPDDAIILGLLAGVFCFWSCTTLKNTFKYDDSLDAFGVHGMGGILGALLTGVFATQALVDHKHRGAIEGNVGQLIPQVVSILATIGIAVVGTIVILKVLDAFVGLRVSQESEIKGLDLSEHNEEGYIFF